jgi:hypothetical protein
MQFRLQNIHLPLFVAALVMAGFSQAIASPQCSQILMNEPIKVTSDLLDRTIENIARLKITADTQKASGVGSLAFADKLYKLKMTELTHILQGVKSEAELQNLIAKKISALQGNNEKVEKKARAQRTKEKEFFTPDLVYKKQYGKVKRTKLPFGISYDAPFEYVEKIDSLLLVSKGAKKSDSNKVSILLLDTKTMKKTVTLYEGGTGKGNIWQSKMSTDGQFMISFIEDGKLISSQFLIYDIKNATHSFVPISNKVPVKMPRDIVSMDMNPAGTLALLVSKETNGNGSTSAFLINSKTGAATRLSDLSQKLPDSAEEFQFLSNEEIIFKATNKVYLYNLKSKELNSVYESNILITKLMVSRSLKQILIGEGRNSYGAENTFTVGRGSLENVAGQKNILNETQDYRILYPKKTLPHDGVYFEGRKDGGDSMESGFMITHLEQDPYINGTFDEYKTEAFSSENMAVDLKKNKLFFFVKVDFKSYNQERFIDTYEGQ